MNCVLDTNVVVSGFLWRGAPKKIIDLVTTGIITAYSSEPLIEELSTTLSYKKLAPVLKAYSWQAQTLVERYESIVTLVQPQTLSSKVIIADEDDDAVIATALSSNAEFVVSGDKHLLELRHNFSFTILSPSSFLHTI